jgi:hypothetical protein
MYCFEADLSTNGMNLELSKCPIAIRNTAQQGSPAEPHYDGVFSMPTSRVPMKCPIEVGVVSEVRNAANPDIMGLYAELSPPELPRQSARSELQIEAKFLHHPHEAHKYVEPHNCWAKRGNSIDCPTN